MPKRRAVLCKVFQDISAFIPSPLTTNGQNNKVNIWIRDINLNLGLPNGTLSFGSAFYNVPKFFITKGIADNEIWRTIHTGQDSYANSPSFPLITTSSNSSASGNFYHGYLAFNFGVGDWNTDTSVQATAAQYDLYTVALHEIMHALGFNSLINQNGTSRLKISSCQYFTRYDTFLRNIATNTPILTKSLVTPMYNNGFNPAFNPNILTPGCTISGNINFGPSIDNTNCGTTIRYVSPSTNMPVYTPACFEFNNSFSHFEDQCTPTAGFINNGYFAMCNALLTGVTRRYIKPEERNVLCDIGYRVNTTYGVSGTFINGTATSFNYGGNACSGITVAGINDGVNTMGAFTFIGNIGANIPISGATILGNDIGIGTTGTFRNLQDLTTGFMLLTSGTASTNYTFNSTVSGIHLLRYVPFNNNQFGNITYIYVYVIPIPAAGSCSPIPNACDFVMNGGFEQNSSAPTSTAQIIKACGYADAAGIINGSVDLFRKDPSVALVISIPCNAFGYQDEMILGVPNNRYAGFSVRRNDAIKHDYEMLKTELKSPLIQGETYQLTFNVSLADKSSTNAIKMQAYLGDEIFPAVNELPIPVPSSLLTNTNFSTNATAWDTVTFNYTAIGTEKFLYVGALNNTPTMVVPQTLNPVYCNYSSIGLSPIPATSTGKSYYYLDNISLIQLNGTSFDLPTTLACSTTTLPNLMNYIIGAPISGVFTGLGVQFIGGIYSFNPTIAGTGVKTITYTYYNGSCPVTLIKNINVTSTGVTPVFNFIPAICAGLPSPLPTTWGIGNTGTWSPAYNNTLTGTYVFTPTGALCPTNTVTVTVLQPNTYVANNDVFTVNYPTAQSITSSVLANDTINGALINNTNNAGLVMTLVTALNPVFTTGGITLDINGQLNAAANTPAGTYTIYYTITKNCSAVSQGVITLTINPLIIARANFCFYKFCYSDNAQISINSVLGATAGECPPNPLTYPAVTIGGVAANASNISIYPVGTLPTGFSFNPDGTVNVAGGTLPVFNIPLSYKLCPPNSPNSPNCTGTINAKVFNASTISAGNDVVRFTGNNTNTYPGYGNNVLFNDSKYSCTTVAFSPATNTNVILTQLSTSNPAFSINPAGIVVGTSYLTGATATLTYQICDSTYPNICGTATVDVCVCPPPYRMANPDKGSTNDSKWSDIEIVPNPSDNVFNINFIDTVKTPTTIEVYNMLGQAVFKDTINDTNTYSFDASNLPTATYILKLSNENEVVTKKLIKN